MNSTSETIFRPFIFNEKQTRVLQCTRPPSVPQDLYFNLTVSTLCDRFLANFPITCSSEELFFQLLFQALIQLFTIPENLHAIMQTNNGARLLVELSLAGETFDLMEACNILGFQLPRNRVHMTDLDARTTLWAELTTLLRLCLLKGTTLDEEEKVHISSVLFDPADAFAEPQKISISPDSGLVYVKCPKCALIKGFPKLEKYECEECKQEELVILSKDPKKCSKCSVFTEEGEMCSKCYSKVHLISAPMSVEHPFLIEPAIPTDSEILPTTMLIVGSKSNFDVRPIALYPLLKSILGAERVGVTLLINKTVLTILLDDDEGKEAIYITSQGNVRLPLHGLTKEQLDSVPNETLRRTLQETLFDKDGSAYSWEILFSFTSKQPKQQMSWTSSEQMQLEFQNAWNTYYEQAKEGVRGLSFEESKRNHVFQAIAQLFHKNTQTLSGPCRLALNDVLDKYYPTNKKRVRKDKSLVPTTTAQKKQKTARSRRDPFNPSTYSKPRKTSRKPTTKRLSSEAKDDFSSSLSSSSSSSITTSDSLDISPTTSITNASTSDISN